MVKFPYMIMIRYMITIPYMIMMMVDPNEIKFQNLSFTLNIAIAHGHL